MLFQCTEVNSKVKNVQKYHKSSVLYFIVPVAPTTVHNTRGCGFNSQRIHGKHMGENSHYGYTYMWMLFYQPMGKLSEAYNSFVKNRPIFKTVVHWKSWLKTTAFTIHLKTYFLAVDIIKGQELHTILISSCLYHQKFLCGNITKLILCSIKTKKYKFGATLEGEQMKDFFILDKLSH